ncbi:MAG: hypothetical protein JAY75_14965 [Candidatus Thiodiazotropha taylori]|nr:hypothetical protein [Candidatus Thiodiazotropha taylori]MCW4309516.1 hypothetical protein [Candidatus Thiodiazotropha endolucinida]
MAIQDRHWYIEELKKRDRHKRGGRHGAASLKALTVILSSFGLGFLSALLFAYAFPVHILETLEHPFWQPVNIDSGNA